MNTADDLLTEFRSDVPPPDEATAQRIYAAATNARRALPRTKLVLALTAAAVAAAGAAVIAGVFAGTTPKVRTQDGATGHYPKAMIIVSYDRATDGSLNAVDLTVNPSMGDAHIRFLVRHTDETAPAPWAQPGGNPPSEVVFTEEVAATDTPGGANGESTWSGSLSPSDWSGGCQSGSYDIVAYAGGPGASLDGPATQRGDPPVDEYHSGWFNCTDG